MNLDDGYLFDMFILESFQVGLSWVCLNKRESFKRIFDNFDICKVFLHTEEKINKLMNNKEL